ncbi:hypothetical protein ACROYT_G020290 [Oculina patagonica]
MILFFGLLLFLKLLTTEGCSANQHSTLSLTAGEDARELQNGTFFLPFNSTCQWNITAPEGKAIDFEDCSINSSLDVSLSPMEHTFSSPYWPQGYPMNKTCGCDDKQNWMEEGLFVSYTAITPAHSCSSGNSLDGNQNIVLKDPSGVIKTPGYPSNYPHNLIHHSLRTRRISACRFSPPARRRLRPHQCYWKIFAPKGKVVRVDFSSFLLPKGTCVDVVNAINNRFPMESTHCLQKPPFVVYSMTNELGIKVQERYNFTGPGFTANYTVVTADSSGNCRPSENSTVHMAGEGMSFASPGFPLPPENGSCNWNISVPPGNFIKLSFWRLFGSCSISYVEVYDVTNSTWIYLEKLCFIYAAPGKVVYSKGNNLLVRYVSAKPVPSISWYTGFLASYETVKTAVPAAYACSVLVGSRIKLHGTHGELASFRYPMPYSNYVSCGWTIEVPVGYIVNLTFHSFALQQSQNCQADYVAIKQGKYYSQASEIGKFCGSSLPGVIQSNSSKMYVDFVVDSFGRYPGFHASYLAVTDPAMGPCKTQGIDNVIPLSGESGRLYSPLYPQTFPNKITCTWIISVPEGNFVKLRITSFFLAYICKEGTNLEIRDGQSSSSELLKTFCGQTYESSVFSSGRYLWVRFQSSQHSYQYGSGFNAQFETVSQLPDSFSCTAHNLRTKLESKTGTLASYNYPLPYDDSVECVWKIKVDSDYKIELSFDFFNLSDSTDCSEDFVEVRDGLFSTSDLVGKYCGADKPSKITSDAWDLRVAFTSSGKTKYPGFKASYEIKKSGKYSMGPSSRPGPVLGHFLFNAVFRAPVELKEKVISIKR